MIKIDYTKDSMLTNFGKAILADRYLYKSCEYQELFARVAQYYSNDADHADRLYKYISNLWFMPATPILSNGGTDRGLPISCFLNETEDSLKGIADLWMENVWLSAKGGGIGSYWGNLRAIGQPVRNTGQTSGIIPFIAVQNALTLAISQGSLRRGSAAVYLPITHPEIEEFIDMRKPTGGDPSRKALNLHHAVVITDEVMKAIEEDGKIELRNPHNNYLIETVRARDIWIKILTARVETGEPYLLFIDAVNEQRPDIYKKLGIKVKTSNLCNEITLTTGADHLGNNRTALCCLSSLNLEFYDKWKDNEAFIPDVMSFLDNVLEDFINKSTDEMYKAKYAALRERSVGMGCMGFHSLLQKKMIPFESAVAKELNIQIFKDIRQQANKASEALAMKKGACLDGQECGISERFTHKIAVAPTASISIIAGNTSPGIEPYVANIFTQKTLTGSFSVKNKFLEQLLEKKKQNTQHVWTSIASHEGSIQHLDFLTGYEKQIFKTAFEINQNWIIEHAADRAPYICQSQSLNLFLPANVDKRELNAIHMLAWKKKLKGLYYCRSSSIQRPDKISKIVDTNADECLSCQ